MTTVAICIGIDVSKDRLDLAWRPTGERWTAPNTERGIRAICRRLRAAAPANELWVSPISTWEMILLAEKGRVILEPDPVNLDSQGL